MKSIFCLFLAIAFSTSSFAQDRSETKRGVFTQYYGQSDTVHITGKVRSENREGTWYWYAYSTTGEKYIYKKVTYEAGVKEGPFYIVSGDSIDKGYYQTDKYHGNFERQKFTVTAAGDTTKVPHMIGEFNQDVRVGNWKFYKNGKLHQGGGYLAGKRDGKWRVYNIHSGKKEDIISATNYENGFKNGQEIIFYQLDENNTPVQIYSEYTWLGGVKQGPFLIKDHDGFEIEKGAYIADKKNGNIITYDRDTKTYLHSNYMDGAQSGPATFKTREGVTTITGGFLAGKRNGLWTWVKANGDPIRTVDYSNGIVDGKVFERYDSGLKKVMIKVKDNQPVAYTAYAIDGSSVNEEFQMEYDRPEDGWVRIHQSTYEGNSVITYSFEMQPEKPLTWENFREAFKDAQFKQRKFYSQGMYSKLVEGKMIEQGNFTKGKRDGLWDFKYNNEAIWQITYTNGEITDEQFLDAGTKEPFKGNYIVLFPNKQEQYNFKIKDGKRHGKCLTYAEDGMLLLDQKFKDGVLE